MNIFRTNHLYLAKGVNCAFLRYLYKQIDWNLRVIGISGPRGIGKTTLLLQRIKLKYEDDVNVLYLNMDNLWFQRKTLTDTVKDFCVNGGTHLFLDNVHCYPLWMGEVNKMLKRYPSLHIIYTVSNLVSTEAIGQNVKWETKCYRMHTMSFREYLAYESVLNTPAMSVDDLVANHAALVRMVNKKINVVTMFRNYLEHGCYPSYWENPDKFNISVCNSVRATLEVDLPQLRSTSPENVIKLKYLLMRIAEKVPGLYRIQDMAREMKIPRAQADDYIHLLEECGLLRLPDYSPEVAPDKKKIYLGNTNLLVTLFGDKDNRRNMGETFFMDQLTAVTSVSMPAADEYLVGDKYMFMVGDPLGDYDRVRSRDNAFAAIYGIPKSITNRMPIWALGFLY